ncbi:type VII secretion protein EccB [Catenulispora pinisilvae]|uniref:type VII secretion protein EccB n=1 Tax=Catenulispora pinisilvae TaxID=2705253 RepID=UPI0018925094|nr:type VII secretion protein EccB [Catenulispora pinisilvae]
MATRKEQLTAAEFSRRRVLGAVLRPSAGGVGEGVPRPFRTLFVAAIVVVIALGAAVVVGYLHPTPKNTWQKDLIADGTGTQYVMLDGRLHPILNTTSAQLMLGPTPIVAQPKPSQLAPYLKRVGAAVGLSKIPGAVPPAASLDLKDWTACVTPTGKTAVEVGFAVGGPSDPGALSGPDALLVQDDSGQQWVVEDGLKYRVGDRASVTAAFGIGALKARHVPATWLGGLSAGDVLGVPTISGRYGGPDPRPAPAGFNRIGMFGRTLGPGGTVADYYLVTGDGIAAVTPTMYDLYRRDPRLSEYRFTETTLPPGKLTPDMMVTMAASQTLSWPTQPPHFSTATQNPDSSAPVLCATFSGVFDQQGRAHTEVALRPSLPQPLAPDAGNVAVRPGHGTIVRESGSDPATAPDYLVTDNGLRYELVGSAALRLGYDGIASCEVPSEWLHVVPLGPALDPSKAEMPAEPAS